MYELSFSSDGRDAAEGFRAKIAAGVHGLGPGERRRVWIANHLFQRDPGSLAWAALAADPRIDIALMAMSPFTVHPVQLAMTAATLDEFYPGRIALCLGVGAPADLISIAREVEKPIGPMREAIRLIRELLGGETVSTEGQSFSVRRRKLVNAAGRVPVILAASGPKMLQLAGAEADGVLISAATSVEFVRWCLEQVEAGAKGRGLQRIGLVYGAVAERAADAHRHLKRALAITLRGAHHAHNLALAGNNLDQKALTAAVGAENWDAAFALITDRIVATHTASGVPADVAQRFSAYRSAGLDELVLSGVSETRQLTGLIDAASLAAKGDA